jgi:hypothetical protein
VGARGKAKQRGLGCKLASEQEARWNGGTAAIRPATGPENGDVPRHEEGAGAHCGSERGQELRGPMAAALAGGAAGGLGRRSTTQVGDKAEPKWDGRLLMGPDGTATLQSMHA